MLRTGKEHLETLRDGRVVYVGGERIDDVTTHPWFSAAAQTVAGIYDLKADPANRDTMTYEEDGSRYSIYYLRPKTREDLARLLSPMRLTAEVFERAVDIRNPDDGQVLERARRRFRHDVGHPGGPPLGNDDAGSPGRVRRPDDRAQVVRVLDSVEHHH